MRLLLDECVDQSLRHFFTGHDCHTAAYAGLAGLKNGALLSAGAAGFDVIVTTDQEIPHQQNLRDRRISMLILCGRTNRLADLRGLVSDALNAIDSIGRGQTVIVKTRQPTP